MAEISSNNKRIAKNTLMLYIRMGLSTVVSLYTSRVVLQTLGVEDYGIYGVVGGVVAMFSFLNSTMAGATSRFLTFEMGKGDKERLKDTFSSALIIHIGIALLVLILAETVGLWFLNNKLVIPEGRMGAAHWVFQFSVLGMFVGFTQVPYNATIIAHEKMDIYAYIELLHVFLKLGIVYLLVIGNFDKLILYALLTLVVNVIIAMIYRIYCIRHYEESKFKAHLDKDISKNILSFSAYNLLGNMGAVVNMQGTNFVINMFFGVIYNAAASIGTTISGVVTGFASNIMTAFRPQITKSYAQDNIPEFQSLLSWAIKSILLIYSLIAIPVGFAIDEILSLWLVEVPVYADVFCQLLLISIFFETTRFIIIMGIHATGVVKFVSIFAGITFCLNPFIIYLLYSLNLSPAYAYVSVIFVNIILSIINVFILKHNEPRISLRKLVATILQVIFVVLITIGIVYFVCQYKTEKAFVDIIIIGVTSSILMCLLGLFVALNKEQRQRALRIIRSKIKK
jgi:O-antigen/teichoic acid export membrane protein